MSDNILKRRIEGTVFTRSDKTIYFVDTKATVEQALKVLSEKNILSVPIWDEKSKLFVGLIDMVDILSFLVEILNESEIDASRRKYLTLTDYFKNSNVASVSDLSRRDPWIPLACNAKIASLLETLSKQGAHRVPIMDPLNGELLQLITQSDVINFVAKNIDRFGTVVCKTLAELKLGSSPVVSVDIDGRLKDAFRLIVEKKVSAVAVVDSSLTLIATLSVRDLRTLSGEARLLEKLNMKIRDFLGAMVDPTIDIMNPAICCTVKDTLSVAINKLAATRVHRIFVVNDSKKPVAVVSLSDILGVFIPQSSN